MTVADGYVTGANAKLGKGDPCMFVGYRTTDLSGLTAAQLQAIIDAAKWRMPTGKENITFVGAQNHANAATWAPGSSSFAMYQLSGGDGTTTLNYFDTTASKGIRGGYFPGTTTSSLNTTGAFLPAAGSRNNSGATYTVGTDGYFWSYSSSLGHNLYFIGSGITPVNSNSYASGHAVRCVLK